MLALIPWAILAYLGYSVARLVEKGQPPPEKPDIQPETLPAAVALQSLVIEAAYYGLSDYELLQLLQLYDGLIDSGPCKQEAVIIDSIEFNTTTKKVKFHEKHRQP